MTVTGTGRQWRWQLIHTSFNWQPARSAIWDQRKSVNGKFTFDHWIFGKQEHQIQPKIFGDLDYTKMCAISLESCLQTATIWCLKSHHQIIYREA